MRLGFFDSGLGGFFMMESCIKKNPNHEYIYVGDTEHLPYGPRPAKEIYTIMRPYLLWLLEEKKCDYVVIACNTAAVQALPLFIKEFPEHKNHILNIIHGTLGFLNSRSLDQSSVLVLATQGTTASGIYKKSYDQVAMPGLVECIESNDCSSALAMVSDVISHYHNIDTILLACTHYVYLKEMLQQKYPTINFISQDVFLVEIINTFASSIDPSVPIYYTTADPTRYIDRYHKQFHLLSLKK